MIYEMIYEEIIKITAKKTYSMPTRSDQLVIATMSHFQPFNWRA